MALRSAISLGINLRLTDDKTHNASKEARCRLWWSIYSVEHLLTSMHGRASCVGESLCAVPAPTPLEEETFDQPEVHRILHDRTYRETQLRPTLFESLNQLKKSTSWTAACTPSQSLFFYYLIDLALISQAVLNKVYSIEGVREGASLAEYRLQIYGLRMDRWLSNLPPSYTFIVPNSGPWHLNHAELDDESAPFTRERVCLAMNYYSARITLCRPCLSQTHAHNHPANNSNSNKHTRKDTQPGAKEAEAEAEAAAANPRAHFRSEMATNCLQAACALISILPENPDVTWLARITPWWSVLHFLMQATTALLLSLSHCTLPPDHDAKRTNPKPTTETHTTDEPSPRHNPNFPPLLETDLAAAISQTRKALIWIHAMALVDAAARRAFLLCDGVVRKIAPVLEIELDSWPSREGLGGDEGDEEMGMRMEGLDELVDFEGGAGFS